MNDVSPPVSIGAQRPLRVLFLATYFPKPDNSLMGTWALSQAQALRRQGLDLRVVSLTSWVPRVAGRFSAGARAYSHCPPVHYWGELRVEYPRWLLYPVEPVKLWAYPNPEPQLRLGWLSARRVLLRIVRESRPDVIYAHHTGANGYLAERLHRCTGVPYVITDHNFAEISDCEKFPRRRRVFERVMKRAATMVAVASRMEADMKRLFPSARSCTVHNGADPVPEVMKQAPRPPEIADKIVVFSAGMFFEQKAYPLLVRAWGQVAARHPDAVLRIAGDGVQRTLIEQEIRAAGLEKRVQLLGAQPHQRVLQEMAWADVFVLASWNDLFPTVFLEAMAARKPMVWCADSGICDVLRDGEHGYKVPPRDVEAIAAALDRLLADAAARQRMGRAAYELFEANLTWDANARAMRKIFEAACPQRQKAGI